MARRIFVGSHNTRKPRVFYRFNARRHFSWYIHTRQRKQPRNAW